MQEETGMPECVQQARGLFFVFAIVERERGSDGIDIHENQRIDAVHQLADGEVVREVDDEEERNKGEGAPGVRGDVGTHGVHIPQAHESDEDEAEDAGGVSRAKSHGPDRTS